VDPVQDRQEVRGEEVEVCRLLAGEGPDVLDVADGEDQQVPGVVRIQVHGDHEERIAVNGQVRWRHRAVANGAEDTALRALAPDVAHLVEAEEVLAGLPPHGRIVDARQRSGKARRGHGGPSEARVY
jgi:hypothetical protein